MIDRDDRLPAAGQCELLDVARSTVYYQPKPAPQGDIDLIRRIDQIASRSRRLRALASCPRTLARWRGVRVCQPPYWFPTGLPAWLIFRPFSWSRRFMGCPTPSPTYHRMV